MSSWREDPIAFQPKSKSGGSWWTEPAVCASREAFQHRLIAEEISRMNGKGSPFTHDKFPKPQKRSSK